MVDLDQITEPTVIFSDSARAAADAFPQNANVAVITALAGIGLDQTRVTLVADPDAGSNLHEISASGAFGTMQLRFENAPLSTNPKSSEMTALSLVRMIENRVRSLVM
jgi:aspartate dehydrogenase